MIFGDKVSIGLVGIPSSGKTTIFNLLTKLTAEVAPYPFTTKSKNHGIMVMYEPRLKTLSEILKSSDVKYPAVEIVDVAGLIKGAHKGEGLGNEFLSYIRPLDAISYVLRYLETVPHIDGTNHIKRDFEVLIYEIAMSDLQIVERRKEKLKKSASVGDKVAKEKMKVLERIEEAIENFSKEGKFKVELSSEEDKRLCALELKELQLISSKPYFILINTDLGKNEWDSLKEGLPESEIIVCDALSEMDVDEAEVRSFGITPLRELITSVVKKILDLVIFFTGFEGKELRSWITKNGTTVYETAGMIHSDMQKGFISADVANFAEYKNCRSDKQAYEKGLFKTVGRDYIIQDGDIVRIKFKI